MIVSINPATRSSGAETSKASPDSSSDSLVFQGALSAATSAQKAASSTTKPSGIVVHDRKVHHSAALKSADAAPDSTTAPLTAASPSPLPPMAVTTRSAELQPKIDATNGGDSFPPTQAESTGISEVPPSAEGDRNHLPGAGDTASQSANGLPTDHEATLRDAIAAVQNASMPTGMLSAGQAATSIGTLSSFPRSGVPLRGMKATPTTQAPFAANTVSSATPDRRHKLPSSDEASNTDSSAASQGNSSDQDSQKTQNLDVNLPQDGPFAPHATPVAALVVNAASSPVHTSGPVQTAPAQASPPSEAYIAQLQPEAVATPFVSSARLIQSIQQSDMRVGLNSLEFGAISIHTSTDRGVISSEITLGHEELARTINSHLSAMQATPGIPQVFSVRVETSSPISGDSSGPSQQSPGDRQQQQTGRTTQSRSTELQPRLEYNLPIPVRNLDGLNARLDIRI